MKSPHARLQHNIEGALWSLPELGTEQTWHKRTNLLNIDVDRAVTLRRHKGMLAVQHTSLTSNLVDASGLVAQTTLLHFDYDPYTRKLEQVTRSQVFPVRPGFVQRESSTVTGELQDLSLRQLGCIAVDLRHAHWLIQNADQDPDIAPATLGNSQPTLEFGAVLEHISGKGK